MSRCPDADLCENLWDKVLDKVGGLVDLELIFLGTLNSSAPHGVNCLHGDIECVGNIQQLCAAHIWQPKHSDGEVDKVKPWADWWDFVQCINYGPRVKIGEDEYAKRCARIVGHDWVGEQVQSCVTNGTGTQLLLDSVKRAQELEIEKSCTVLISEKKVCIHDSTWKSCPEGHEVGDFVSQVRREWKRLNE